MNGLYAATVLQGVISNRHSAPACNGNMEFGLSTKRHPAERVWMEKELSGPCLPPERTRDAPFQRKFNKIVFNKIGKLCQELRSNAAWVGSNSTCVRVEVCVGGSGQTE